MKKMTIKEFNIEHFRKRLKQAYKGMTQEELSEISGVKESTIKYWFRTNELDDHGKEKKKSPSLRDIYKISQALGVSIDYLVNPDVSCKTITKQEIHNYTWLSDKAIDALHEITLKDNLGYYEGDFIDSGAGLVWSNYIRDAINMILENDINLFSLLGIYLTGNVDGYIYGNEANPQYQPFMINENQKPMIPLYSNGIPGHIEFPIELFDTALIDMLKKGLDRIKDNYQKNNEKDMKEFKQEFIKDMIEEFKNMTPENWELERKQALYEIFGNQ